MRTLITGHRGFLGRHFHRALRDRGYDVFGVDVAESPRTEFDPWEPRDCRGVFDSFASYDLVIHCAAVIGGRGLIENNPLATAVNLELDAAMFRWAAMTMPERVVYISSSAVYPTYLQAGNAETRWLAETDVMLDDNWTQGPPDQTYGWSKLVGEHLAGQLRRARVPVTVVRPFSGYGADQDIHYPFPAFIHRARRHADPFVIWGDGRQVRDFVHVSDVVAATLAAVDAGEDGPLNICTGEGMSFDELASMCYGIANYRPDVLHDLHAPQGVRQRVGDPTRMRKIYTPQVDIEDVIREALSGAAVP